MAGLGRRRRGYGRAERFRPDGFEIHAPGGWDAGLSPVRNGRVFNLAKPCHNSRAAEGVDDVGVGMFSVHASIIRHALFAVKLYLTRREGMPISLQIRIAE